MSRYVQYRPDSDERDQLAAGFVDAARINDIVAEPTSNRHCDYMAVLTDGFKNGNWIDPANSHRERAKELLPRAIDAYEKRTGRFVEICRCYRHQDQELPFCAFPDAIDGDTGLTFHIRKRLDTYERAEELGIQPALDRHGQAMMLVTGLPHWGHVNYYEDADTRTRKLGKVHTMDYNFQQARDLEETMLAFLLKVRKRIGNE